MKVKNLISSIKRSNPTRGFVAGLLLLGMVAGTTTSCEDMLDKGNDNVIYADDHVLANPADTVTSLLGILNKLQAIAVRTNLLGEVRADLVKINDNATIDLKNLAALNIDDNNAYNVPSDYYGVINGCNYYLSKADSTAGNANRNEKYFETEIAQVHSIRAWTYLQLVLAYGRVPLVTEPILTKQQSEAQYPMAELTAICDYFIDDLRPYYGKAYPDFVTVGGTVDPQMCFYPTQVVSGDLYLWKAVANHDVEAAKQAAKCYYDYIVWDLSGKKNLTTGNNSIYWSTSQLENDNYRSPNGGLSYMNTGTAAWGERNVESVTVIPMDSAAADGYYNELRTLYNTVQIPELKEASIAPSEALRELSKAQTYVAYDANMQPKAVAEDKLTEEEINEGLFGDLRLWYNYTQRTINWNQQEVDFQQIYKQTYPHVSIYRAAQIYLRLAEALNYAGYPRFAKQILTMGLDQNVIDYEVQPYYTTAEDSAFIKYFQFNTNDFVTKAASYTRTQDPLLGIVLSVSPVLRASDTDCNMWGIHSRGSGLAFLNPDYAPAAVADSTGYPYAEGEAVGVRPQRTDDKYDYPTEPKLTEYPKPSTWDAYPGETVSEEVYKELNSTWYKASLYRLYTSRDSVGSYKKYLEETLPAYEAAMVIYQAQVDSIDAVLAADVAAYEARLETFTTAYKTWYDGAYGNPGFIEKEQLQIDELILNEQALELAFEGNRFYDLMRRALWYRDNSKLAAPIARRDPAVASRLMSGDWYLRWKDKIGK